MALPIQPMKTVVQLSWAVEDGREDIVKMFLERDAILPALRTKSGRTPPSQVAGCRHIRETGVLLELCNQDTATTDQPANQHLRELPRSKMGEL